MAKLASKNKPPKGVLGSLSLFFFFKEKKKNYFDLARCRILQQQLSTVYILSGTRAEWAGWAVGAVQFNIYHTPPLESITCSW